MEPAGHGLLEDCSKLEESRRIYASLEEVGENRKVGINADGTYFVSTGYNTSIYRPFQALFRTLCDYYGYQTNSVGLIHSLGKLYADSNERVHRIVGVADRCLGVVDVLCDAVKALSTFEKAIKVAQKRISTISETYGYELDAASSELIAEEATKLGQLYSYTRENRERLQKELPDLEEKASESDTEEVPPSSTASASRQVNSTLLLGPVELKSLFEKKIDELLALEPRLRTRDRVQSNFEDFFREKFTLEDITDIKKVRDNSSEPLSKGSRIEDEKEYWHGFLGEGYRSELSPEVKKLFQTAFAEAFREAGGKAFTRFQKQVMSTSGSGPTMFEQMLQKVAEREERVAAANAAAGNKTSDDT